MSKIYVRQIEPEHQESPVMQEGDNWNGTWLDGLIVSGNPCFREHTIPEYDLWEKKKYEIHAELKERPGLLLEILHGAGLLSEGQPQSAVCQWMGLRNDILDDMTFYQGANILTTKVLQILTGKRYAYTMLHGCCQSEWNVLFFSVDEWGRDAVREFEAQYFNTGSEWLVHNEDYEPKDPSQISGDTVYISDDWNDTEIRKSLAKVIGVCPEDLVIYKFEGYKRAPLFTMVK